VLELLYQDAHLVAVAKPAGLIVHPTGMAPDRSTCLSLLRARLRRWVYPIHRLDRGASGVLLFALDPATAGVVGRAFAERRVTKTYLAVTRGVLPSEGLIDAPLAEEPGKEPLPAQTSFRRVAHVELPYPVGRYATSRYSLAAVEPRTGRTHQIRRHMAHLRHPLVGDVTWGEGRHNRLFRDVFGVHRLLLHASKLCLTHPETGDDLVIRAPLPGELAALFERLGFHDPSIGAPLGACPLEE
jgi:tRNA pseudouridine65 synthase